MASAWWNLCLVALAASCGFPRLPALAGADGGGDGVGGPLPVSLELLAGDIGGGGNVDGTGAAARFEAPFGMAIDSAGNVYVADQFNSTIRKVTPAGVVSTLAGTAGITGSADGIGAEARFNYPLGVAVDSAGNVYVADTSNCTIRKVTPAGDVTTLAGTAGMSGSADGMGADARFNFPSGVAVDSAGNVYVADTGNSTIRKVTPAGVVSTLAGTAGITGSADGVGAAARFGSPRSIAIDNVRDMYVADESKSTIRKVDPAGDVTTLAGTADMRGDADGTGAAARFANPSGVAVDASGNNVYVADQFNSTIRKVTPAGVVSTLAGTAGMLGSADSTGAPARFNLPAGIAVDSAGKVYVADTGNSTIRKVTPVGVVTTLAGAAPMVGSANGTGADARFNGPSGVTADSAGTVYVADTVNNTIRKVSSAGVVTTLAGVVGVTGSLDGTGADARFNGPSGVAVDSAGNVYVADTGNSTIRKVTPAGDVTTLAGTAGITGSADGIGTEARFNHPFGVAVDSAGNVYVADTANFTIRKVTPAGDVTTLAGMAGSADGTGPDARFRDIRTVAVDSAGNVDVADDANFTIRKVTPAGDVTTLAGTALMAGSADGAGPDARFNVPGGVAVDRDGNVYVADTANSTIRKVNPTGTTTTVAGTAGVAGIFLGVTPRLAFPGSLAIVGDSIVLCDANAVLLLRHGAR